MILIICIANVCYTPPSNLQSRGDAYRRERMVFTADLICRLAEIY